MQIGSGFSHADALNQITRATEQINQLNQRIVDTEQGMSNKLVNMAVDQKVAGSQNPEGLLDLFA